jgi:hypothetical protein
MSDLEVYFSTDVETDGPIPGPFSMLSIGSAAFLRDGTYLGGFSRNLHELPGALQDADTMVFWSKNPEAWTRTRESPVDPQAAMEDFIDWVERTCVVDGVAHKPVFVGYPATFDFMFVYWYMMYFCEESPFGFSALDIKSCAMVKLGTSFRRTTKSNMPKDWFSKLPHTHVALDDAIEQGLLFVKMLDHT